MERAGEVHAEHGLPVVVGELPHHPVAQDARVVDHDVDAAGAPEHVVDAGRDRRCVGHVDLQRDRPRQRGGDLGQRLGVHVGDGERGAGGGEEVAQRPTDAARAAGHEHRAAGEVEREAHEISR